MNSFKALVKREYWEHRGGVFLTPAIMAAIFAALMLIGVLTGDSFVVNNDKGFSFAEKLPQAIEHIEEMPQDMREKGTQIGLHAPVMLFGGVMLVISLFYALGSLYDERKDRSILFWKSLPVSDTATVLSKFVAICFLVPVSYFVVITVFQLYLLVFATVAAWFGGNTGLIIWSSSNFFVVIFNTLSSLIVASLWLAPLWGWFMLASSWAKKVAFLWGTLPLLMIGVAEGWILRTTRFFEMLGARIGEGFAIQNSNLHFLNDGDLFDVKVMSWYEALLSGDFWLGLLVAALLLSAAVYTRRFRNES